MTCQFNEMHEIKIYKTPKLLKATTRGILCKKVLQMNKLVYLLHYLCILNMPQLLTRW